MFFNRRVLWGRQDCWTASHFATLLLDRPTVSQSLGSLFPRFRFRWVQGPLRAITGLTVDHPSHFLFLMTQGWHWIPENGIVDNYDLQISYKTISSLCKWDLFLIFWKPFSALIFYSHKNTHVTTGNIQQTRYYVMMYWVKHLNKLKGVHLKLQKLKTADFVNLSDSKLQCHATGCTYPCVCHYNFWGGLWTNSFLLWWSCTWPRREEVV